MTLFHQSASPLLKLFVIVLALLLLLQPYLIYQSRLMISPIYMLDVSSHLKLNYIEVDKKKELLLLQACPPFLATFAFVFLLADAILFYCFSQPSDCMYIICYILICIYSNSSLISNGYFASPPIHLQMLLDSGKSPLNQEASL